MWLTPRQLVLGAATLVVAPLSSSAQEPTTLTGTVTTTAGAPVEAANVFIETLSLGVLADVQGDYVLSISASIRGRSPTVQVTASLIGYTTVVHTVTLQPGTQSLDFVLEDDPLNISGVTVVALGMERQSRELGISTQQFYGEELTRSEPNLVNTLSGRVPGVNVTNSGPQGGSAYIVIRGENSLASDNQPLFILDGIPVNNNTTVTDGFLSVCCYDPGNAVQDIAPEDIESMTVLKGPNAAALYGSRAANGVILIETKTGPRARGGAEIVVSQQVTFEDELKLPNYQNAYGQGLNGEFEFYDGFGGGVFDDYDESWGPPLDWDPDGDGQVLMIPQWFSPYVATCDCREPAPWVSHPSNVDDFFETGVTSTTNVSVAGSTENLNGRASFGRLSLDGMLPGHTQERTSFTLAGDIRATERFSIGASGQYVTTASVGLPGVGYSGRNVMTGLYWFGRQIDTNRLEALYDQTRPIEEPVIGGYPYSWNTSFTENPYFTQLVDRVEADRNRLVGQISASYQLTDWLGAMVRTGTDWMRRDHFAKSAANPQRANQNGEFIHRGFHEQETNTDFLISADPETGLPFTTSVSFGGSRRDSEVNVDITAADELTTPGTFNVSNASIPPWRFTRAARKRVNSLYGQAEVGYEDYLYLTVTGRNDWSSTLPEANRSYFYPSVSGAFILTELTDALPFSYGKLRASWARVGNDTQPYRLRNTFEAGGIWSGVPSFSLPDVLQNADLRPETTESWELGAELAFLDDRLGLDVTYYTEETRDQLMEVPVSASTGYGRRMANAGTVQNKGWEVLVRGTPYVSRDVRWESTATWAKNWSRVTSLAEGVTGIDLTGDLWFVALWAREGEPLGQLVSQLYDYQYDPDGNLVVRPDGLPHIASAQPQVIGNTNPDWRAGWSNEITYKSARLGFLFDWRQGGEIYSVTKAWGRYAGTLAETAKGGRCSPTGTAMPAYPVCDAATGIVVDGVVETSPGVFDPNTTPVSQQDYWKWNFLFPRANLEDATYIKLRELTLSYRLPDFWTSRWGVDAVDVSLVGRNLWLWAKAEHIDPETSIQGGSAQGFEAGQMPSARSVGVNVTVRL